MPASSSASLSLTLSTALQHALAQVQRLVAVAKFQGLVNARARAAGHRRPAERTVGQLHVDLDGGVSAAIEDLSGMDIENFRIHDGTLLKRNGGRKPDIFLDSPAVG